MDEVEGTVRFTRGLTLLILCALLLLSRLVYLYVADPLRFPVNTVKIVASYQHITRQQLESVLSTYAHDGFFLLPMKALQHDLKALPWTKSVVLERIWPDTLKISLQEKEPIAVWNDALITAEGHVFHEESVSLNKTLPRLEGPVQQKKEVLMIYQTLSRLFKECGLMVDVLQLRENQACEVLLTNGVQLHLGKQDLEQRAVRFCRAYPTVFSEKSEQLVSVDLRYARGMAVQWKGSVHQ